MSKMTHGPKKPPAWAWAILALPITLLAIEAEAFWILPLYVFVSVAVVKPELLREGFKPRESKLTEADKSAMTEATELVDTLIHSQKLKLSDAERAALIMENFHKLNPKEANDD